MSESESLSNPQIICVLGMHRSGTSLIAKVLNLLSVYLGPEEHLLEAAFDNTKGHWEHRPIMAVNDELLSRFGGSWHEPPIFPAGWETAVDIADLRQRARAIVEEDFATSELWGWKDPRTCLVLPFWQRLLPSIRYVICLRNPVDVARSLEQRNGFSFAKSVNLWLSHTKSALEHTAGKSRHFVFYEDFMADWKREVQRLSEFLGKPERAEQAGIQKAIQEFADRELQHYDTPVVDVADEPRLAFPAKALYMVLRAYANNKMAESTQINADRDFQEALDIFGCYSVQSQAHFDQLERQAAENEQVVQTLNAELVEKEQAVQTLSGQVAEREQAAQALTALVAEKEQSVQALSVQVAEKEQSVQALNARIREIYGSRAWRLIQLLWHVRTRLIPHGSRRERFVRTMLQQPRRFRQRWVAESTHYYKWIAANEPSISALKAQHTKANDFSYKPLISLIMPVWNTPKEILNQTISSVLHQTYGNWEFCMVDANSDPDTKKVLLYWSKKDRRIRIKFLDENKGIAVNSDEALSLAQGEFVAFLDHDDLLAPFALFEVVNRLQIDMTADVIYSDEDKIDESGRRFDPFFKPGFSPDYLRSVNYMPHFLVVRKSLGDQVAWFREGYDGAQDYDLILRAVEKAKSVVHIPKVLYHWRAWTSSTAGGTDAKPYANTSGKKALQEHLTRVGLSALVEDGSYSTFYRVRYQLNNNPLISIIIPNQDHALDLEQCVNSIFQKTTYPNFEIILVENGSKEQATFNLYKQLEKDTRIHLINWNEPFNYSRVNNWAATQANGEVILFLNNDIQVINSDWLEQMLQFAIRQDVGAVGAKLYYPDKSIQHAGVIVGVGGVGGHSHKNFPWKHAGYFGRLVSVHNVSAVTAACMMIRKQVLQEVNGFDENYILAFGDVDLCLRILQKGYLNVWTPYAELYHYESKTRGYEDTSKKIKRFNKEIEYFKQKWSDFLQKGDPYYNPNLSLEHEDFRLDLTARK